jgi:hypothetical protein
MFAILPGRYLLVSGQLLPFECCHTSVSWKYLPAPQLDSFSENRSLEIKSPEVSLNSGNKVRRAVRIFQEDACIF